MRRRRLIWITLLASFVAAHVLPAEAGGYRRQVLLHGQQFPASLVVLVDNSGSMDGAPYACATRQATWVAAQASDGAKIRFATFGEEVVWERPGWTKLPDAEALATSRAWLLSRGTAGNTALADAVEAALALEESPIGVVVISDLEPDGGHDATRERIAKANAARKSPATIGIISVAPGRDAKKVALLVAEAAGGPVVELEAKKDEAARK